MACSFQALDGLLSTICTDRQRYILAGATSISGFEAMLCLLYLWHLVRSRGSSKAMKTDIVRPVTTHTAVIGLMVAVAHYTNMWMYSKFVPWSWVAFLLSMRTVTAQLAPQRFREHSSISSRLIWMLVK